MCILVRRSGRSGAQERLKALPAPVGKQNALGDNVVMIDTPQIPQSTAQLAAVIRFTMNRPVIG
jgi:hypothetical protein